MFGTQKVKKPDFSGFSKRAWTFSDSANFDRSNLFHTVLHQSFLQLEKNKLLQGIEKSVLGPADAQALFYCLRFDCD